MTPPSATPQGPIADRSRKARSGKRAAPAVASLLSRCGLMPMLEQAVMYLHFVAGQGSGTGWDAGEYVVAAERVRGLVEAGGRDAVVVDVGANAGWWTRKVRKRLGSSAGRWLLFEPAPQFQQCLAQMENVEVVPVAAGDVEEERDLFVPSEDSGWMSFHERRDSFSQTKTFRPQSVHVVRLDRELERRGVHHVDYLKMDVEGHELFVLRGLGAYLADHRVTALAFEFGAANVNSRTFFRDFWELLVPCGYRIWRIAPGGQLVEVPAYYESLEYFRGATNYLAVAAA
jgi:FkbM family methyltransferase